MAQRQPRDTRKRGGHELPDELQDRPEQNAGYDAAVGADEAPAGEDALPPAPAEGAIERIDRRAERAAAADVRRRERSS